MKIQTGQNPFHATLHYRHQKMVAFYHKTIQIFLFLMIVRHKVQQ